MFNKLYRHSPPVDRVKYGVLNIGQFDCNRVLILTDELFVDTLYVAHVGNLVGHISSLNYMTLYILENCNCAVRKALHFLLHFLWD